MIIPALISVVFLLLVLGAGAALWFILRQRLASGPREPEKRATAGVPIAFRWSYIVVPLVLLFLSVVLAVYFYSRLPVEVAYHFQGDGLPDRWVSRGVIVLWLLLPQLFFTLVAWVLTWGMTRLAALFRPSGSSMVKAGGVLSAMGNMIALPQAVLFVAMLDIFSYNSYQMHLLPLWAIALIIMGVGGIVLGVFFLRAMWRVWGATSKTKER